MDEDAYAHTTTKNDTHTQMHNNDKNAIVNTATNASYQY